MPELTKQDIELITLAAKAQGIVFKGYDSFYEDYSAYDAEDDVNYRWNPLDSDGDALRLAVTLGLSIETLKHKGFDTTVGNQTVFRDDPFEQTRRAIVKYAASNVYKGDSE